MTLPELGYEYGAPILTKSYIKLATDIASGVSMEKRLTEKGFRGVRWNAEHFESFCEGVVPKSKWTRAIIGWLEEFGNWGMALFEKTDVINRVITLNAAEQVTEHLLLGNKQALNFVQNSASPSFTRMTMKALAAGDEKQVANLVETYLIGKTQFSYNRLTLSEFGRYCGPLFSTFTRWPSAIAGELWNINIAAKEKSVPKRVLETGRRYLAPFAAFYAFDSLVLPHVLGDPQDDEFAKLIVGSMGTKTMAPITSFRPAIDGSVFTSGPVMGLAKSTLDGVYGTIMEGDVGHMWKPVNTLGNYFVPGRRFMRFISEDIPVIMQRLER
jgi:hypothetical protein